MSDLKESDLRIAGGKLVSQNRCMAVGVGMPGEQTNDLMIPLLDSKIKFILVTHEQEAAFMADVCGRLYHKVVFLQIFGIRSREIVLENSSTHF
jgi:hypothetical protein